MAKGRYIPSIERMYKHILEGELDRGRSLKTAERIAAATVNKYRAETGATKRGWYPGKGTGHFVCLEHRKTYKTKAGLLGHYRKAH